MKTNEKLITLTEEPISEENTYKPNATIDCLVENVIKQLSNCSESWRTLVSGGAGEFLIQRAETAEMAINIIKLEYEKFKAATGVNK